MNITKQDIFHAMERKEFFFLFQAKVTYPEKDLIGFESLLRWNHPIYGIIPPEKFLPSVIFWRTEDRLTEWIICEIFKFASSWESFKKRKLILAINLYPETLLSLSIDWLKDQTQTFQIPASQIEFELLEPISFEKFGEENIKVFKILEKTFKDLKSLGFRLSLDDYGINPFLDRFLSLPFDTIKIDRLAFRNREILNQAIRVLQRRGFCHFLIEGVSDKEEWDQLKDIPCQEVQGYFIQMPQPIEYLRLWLP